MFPSVTHMIKTNRSRKELKDLADHAVECWRAVNRSPQDRWRDDRLYDERISDRDLRARARALVRHCLGKPVTAD